MKKKVLALMLSAALICSSATVAFAAGDEAAAGTGAENVEEIVSDGAEDAGNIQEPGAESGMEDSEKAVSKDSIPAADSQNAEETESEAEKSESASQDSTAENGAENSLPESNENSGIAFLADDEADTQEANVFQSGEFGNLTWVLTDDWTLTISGYGDEYIGRRTLGRLCWSHQEGDYRRWCAKHRSWSFFVGNKPYRDSNSGKREYYRVIGVCILHGIDRNYNSGKCRIY